jgi:phosphatidylglycerophosphatase A
MIQLLKINKQNKSESGAEPSFLTKLCATSLFLGYAPIAPGTVSSLFAVGLYYIPGFENPTLFSIVILVTLALGTRTADIMEKYHGHDPAEVTIDEVAGMWLSLFLLPKTILVVLAAFIVFRLIDIIKPFPARSFDSMNGGFGIMMDDIVSAIYTNIIIQITLHTPFLKDFLLK